LRPARNHEFLRTRTGHKLGLSRLFGFRWTGSGQGKRGGARVIFYSAEVVYVYLMTIYAKNKQAGIPAIELKET